MRNRYAKEKLSSAVRLLATNKGDIKVGLWNAYLIFHPLTETDFSEDLREEWNIIHRNLTTEEPSYDEKGEVTDGRVQNTLKKLSHNKCQELVSMIKSLESKL